jgi:hypothetical protein
MMPGGVLFRSGCAEPAKRAFAVISEMAGTDGEGKWRYPCHCRKPKGGGPQCLICYDGSSDEEFVGAFRNVRSGLDQGEGAGVIAHMWFRYDGAGGAR